MRRHSDSTAALAPVPVRRRLLRWYDDQRRDLPWRKTKDPYRIWVSEVMLQQTRVQAVIPYYKRFLLQFPDMRALAAAREEKVLACWSGLGYYSRARNLRKAARAIMRQYGGAFPRILRQAEALPGVGRYTAAAVLSIAYAVPVPVLDGNVTRVVSRLYAVGADPKSSRDRTLLLQLVASLLSRRRPGDFNQAMMELGATVCLPRQPRCDACPLRRSCVAYKHDEVTKFPATARKARAVVKRLIAAVVQDSAGRWLLLRRPQAAARLGGFWEVPLWERAKKGAAPPGIVLKERLGTVRHVITNNRLEIEVFGAALRGRKTPESARWIAPLALRLHAVTGVTRKALALCAGS
jgi:A/G-specific adenine glycosylase